MADADGAQCGKTREEKTLMITHCNCPERAESVKRMVTSKVSVKDVVIMDTAGVSSMYPMTAALS